jgi:hypothetical protein
MAGEKLEGKQQSARDKAQEGRQKAVGRRQRSVLTTDD